MRQDNAYLVCRACLCVVGLILFSEKVWSAPRKIPGAAKPAADSGAPPIVPRPRVGPPFSQYAPGVSDQPNQPIPPVPYMPPPPPHFPIAAPRPVFRVREVKPFARRRARPRPEIFLTTPERGYRSRFFPPPEMMKASAGPLPESGISEELLSLQTVNREAENDAAVSEHEYKNELLKVEIHRKLHQGAEALYKRKVISEIAYEECRTRLVKSEYRTEELKHRAIEFKTEVAINAWKFSKATGKGAKLLDLAKSYAVLWEARLAKMKAVEGQAKAEYDFTLLVLKKDELLNRTKAVSLESVLHAQKDFDEAQTVWRLSKELVGNNARSYQDSLAAVKSIEQDEARVRSIESSGL